ncbi:hypothetical protein [Xanthomonas oryzae]|uniref:hypothetical protein n=1 Tax=Xanthomonas oryzae TaxID=347 RepID=UPI0009E81FC0|nr:hypothetical protein [Xanthomonas oryzae]WVN05239.1 hypothetical protein V1208_12320 [Xanthomonas oryzae pv. oryzicola]
MTAVAGTAAIHNPTTVQGLVNLARTGALTDQIGRSFTEAAERHLMTETVVPSMDGQIQSLEHKARAQAAPQHTSPTLQESMRGAISPPSTTQATTTAQLRQQQPELHMQHQHQALEQQRQWQLQQELSLQQERGRLAAQEKTVKSNVTRNSQPRSATARLPGIRRTCAP